MRKNMSSLNNMTTTVTSKTREKFTEVLGRAKQSLKILESLDRETIARARSFVKQPLTSLTQNRRRMTDEKILSHLKKLGLATQAEVESLRDQVHKLEEEITARNSRKTPRSTLPTG